MARARDTGFPTSDAQDDFMRARRGQALSRLRRRLAGQPGDVDVILPFDEVVAALGRVGEKSLGLQTIDIDTILGTVDRTSGFDRQFRPTSSRVRTRWERIANAMRRGEPMPPISVYRIGEVHFVRDGHHRVSVARAMGLTQIDAYVTEVTTRVPIDRALRAGDLPLKSHERVFLERVPLSKAEFEEVRLSDPWQYATLAEGVEAWGFRLIQECGEPLNRSDVSRRWLRDEFRPVVLMLHEADLIGKGTDADAYLRIAAERYRLMRTHDWNDEVIDRIRRELR